MLKTFHFTFFDLHFASLLTIILLLIKCGTTTLEANLGELAPLPIADVCVPVHQTVYYAYKNWPGEYDPNATKPLRGTKCPTYVENAQEVTKYLPKTKMIIGIRHPIAWFQSFWNMLAKSKYTRTFQVVLT
jgi:hypothetical protein